MCPKFCVNFVETTPPLKYTKYHISTNLLTVLKQESAHVPTILEPQSASRSDGKGQME